MSESHPAFRIHCSCSPLCEGTMALSNQNQRPLARSCQPDTTESDHGRLKAVFLFELMNAHQLYQFFCIYMHVYIYIHIYIYTNFEYIAMWIREQNIAAVKYPCKVCLQLTDRIANSTNNGIIDWVYIWLCFKHAPYLACLQNKRESFFWFKREKNMLQKFGAQQ